MTQDFLLSLGPIFIQLCFEWLPPNPAPQTSVPSDEGDGHETWVSCPRYQPLPSPNPQLLGAVLEGLFSEMSYLFQAVRHLCSLSWELLSSMGVPKMG